MSGHVEPPGRGTWVLDPHRSSVVFVARHLGLSQVRGRFRRVVGVVEIADRLADSAVRVTIDVSSLDSGARRRDDRLRSAKLLDVAAFPTATFRSTSVHPSGRTGTVAGDLTIRGTGRPVELRVDYLGASREPSGVERASFRADARLRRADWALGWNALLEAGGLLVARQVRLEIAAVLVRDASA